jgi:hypothetical protein
VTAKNRDAHRDSASSWGSAGAVCSTRAGLLVLAYLPVRWALKVDGEVGLNGLAGFSGFALGAPAGSLPVLDADFGGGSSAAGPATQTAAI